MGMGEAVQSGFQHFVNWKGRASRPAFWWFFLFYVITLVVTGIIDQLIGTGILYIIAAVAFILPLLSVQVRRLHDTGRTGWWWWIGIIPIVGTIVLIVFYLLASEEGENQYGPNPQGGVSGSGVE